MYVKGWALNWSLQGEEEEDLNVDDNFQAWIVAAQKYLLYKKWESFMIKNPCALGETMKDFVEN